MRYPFFLLALIRTCLASHLVIFVVLFLLLEAPQSPQEGSSPLRQPTTVWSSLFGSQPPITAQVVFSRRANVQVSPTLLFTLVRNRLDDEAEAYEGVDVGVVGAGIAGLGAAKALQSMRFRLDIPAECCAGNKVTNLVRCVVVRGDLVAVSWQGPELPPPLASNLDDAAIAHCPPWPWGASPRWYTTTPDNHSSYFPATTATPQSPTSPGVCAVRPAILSAVSATTLHLLRERSLHVILHLSDFVELLARFESRLFAEIAHWVLEPLVCLIFRQQRQNQTPSDRNDGDGPPTTTDTKSLLEGGANKKVSLVIGDDPILSSALFIIRIAGQASTAGPSVAVLEGSNRIGGRVRTIHLRGGGLSSASPPNDVVDLGATFIHFRQHYSNSENPGTDLSSDEADHANLVAETNPMLEVAEALDFYTVAPLLSKLRAQSKNASSLELSNNAADSNGRPSILSTRRMVFINYSNCRYFDRTGHVVNNEAQEDATELFVATVYEGVYKERQRHWKRNARDSSSSSDDYDEALGGLIQASLEKELAHRERLHSATLADSTDDPRASGMYGSENEKMIASKSTETAVEDRESTNDKQEGEEEEEGEFAFDSPAEADAFSLLCFQHIVQDLQALPQEVSARGFDSDASMGPLQERDRVPSAGMESLLRRWWVEGKRFQPGDTIHSPNPRAESLQGNASPRVLTSFPVRRVHYDCGHCSVGSDSVSFIADLWKDWGWTHSDESSIAEAKASSKSERRNRKRGENKSLHSGAIVEFDNFQEQSASVLDVTEHFSDVIDSTATLWKEAIVRAHNAINTRWSPTTMGDAGTPPSMPIEKTRPGLYAGFLMDAFLRAVFGFRTACQYSSMLFLDMVLLVFRAVVACASRDCSAPFSSNFHSGVDSKPHPALIHLESTDGHKPSSLLAKKVIVTVPIGVLKASLRFAAIQEEGKDEARADRHLEPPLTLQKDNFPDALMFDPPLPPFVEEAIRNMGVRNVLKVALCWDDRDGLERWLDAIIINPVEPRPPREERNEEGVEPPQLPPNFFVHSSDDPAPSSAVPANTYYHFSDASVQRGPFGQGPHIELINTQQIGQARGCLVAGIEADLADAFIRHLERHPSPLSDSIPPAPPSHQSEQQDSHGRRVGAGEAGLVEYLVRRLQSLRGGSTSAANPLPRMQATCPQQQTQQQGSRKWCRLDGGKAFFSQWHAPFTRGGYAFRRVDGDAAMDSRALSGHHIDRRLFFAGEHVSAHSYGNVQGALETGEAAAAAAWHLLVEDELVLACVVVGSHIVGVVFVALVVWTVFRKLLSSRVWKILEHP